MATTYYDANKEIEEITQGYVDIGSELENKYIDKSKVTELLKDPVKRNQLREKQNALAREIKASNLNPVEIVALRQKFEQANKEYDNLVTIATNIEKRLFGMQTKEQQQQTAEIKAKIMELPKVPKRTRLIIETTDSATIKTHKILKDTMIPSFKGSKEYRQGEYTVKLEEEL